MITLIECHRGPTMPQLPYPNKGTSRQAWCYLSSHEYAHMHTMLTQTDSCA